MPNGSDVEDDVELIGGPERRELTLLPHDPRWPSQAAAHLDRVRAALAATPATLRVAHIGSTSVPDLIAKPVIDLQLALPDVDDEASYLPALARAGYHLRVRERLGRHRMLRTAAHDVHLHVWDLGSDDERRHLLFADHLRAHPEDASRYAAVKRELARDAWPTMDHYADAKSEVIVAITARAERWAARTGWAVDPDPAPVGGFGRPVHRT